MHCNYWDRIRSWNVHFYLFVVMLMIWWDTQDWSPDANWHTPLNNWLPVRCVDTLYPAYCDWDGRPHVNPLSPHDALKHHLTSLKTDLIYLQPWVLEWKFPWNWFANSWQFSLIFKPHQIIFIHYKSRIVVDEDVNGNSGLKGLKQHFQTI